MTDSDEAEGQLHWIITFLFPFPGGMNVKTVDGTLIPGTYPNRRAAFRGIEASMKAHFNLPDETVVTFFSLEHVKCSCASWPSSTSTPPRRADMADDPTPHQILNLTMNVEQGPLTIRERLVDLLAQVWADPMGFDGKRPWGFSTWRWDFYNPMIEAGFITEDEQSKGDALIAEAIKALAGDSLAPPDSRTGRGRAVGINDSAP